MNQIPQHSPTKDTDSPPAGYVRIKAGKRSAVTCNWAAPVIGKLLEDHTLHDWASMQSTHDLMRGRGVNYGVVLPCGIESGSATDVVVRRNRHGGLFRHFTCDFFLPPTRAPHELATSLRLLKAGIPTPEVIAYAMYPAGGIFVRSDVMTRRLPKGADLPEAWQESDGLTRDLILESVASLLRKLAIAGAWHEDINLKNIYIANQGGEITSYLLDVDRVSFPDFGDIALRNFNRLARSARKWRNKWGLDFDENCIEFLARFSQEK